MVSVQTHREVLLFLSRSLKKALFPTPAANTTYGLSWVTKGFRWDVSCSVYHVSLPTKHHLLQLRADFLPVSLLQKSIAVWFLCAFPPQHPSPLGSCLLSFLVHHQWAKRLEKQICWLEVHWFKFRVWWYDREGKMTLWQIFPAKWTFICISVLPIKGNYTNKCCGCWHRNGNLNCS